ncbi:uncharacterized protein LOC119836072 [Zerene cesonia]|uniref:uncharacterized protein LOC119836072 n=1 Tax=Zerene cesonia TaxID=33412 RepID=UPI0018E4F088|nr:uncharacterized protein LOC119836072 [Zerene cesonia]
MFKILPILLLTNNIIVKCVSDLEITINVAPNKDKNNVTYSGVDEKLISGTDIILFNITKENLKRGCRVEFGQTPDEVFLKDPTEYHNLYSKFDWKQVNRDIRVKNVEIYDTIIEDVVLKSSSHINNTTDTIKSKIALYERVENTVVTKWSNTGYPGEFSYNVNANFDGIRFKIKHSWRKNEMKFVSVNFGASRQGFIYLRPNQISSTVLTAKRIIIIVKIDFVTSLSGCVVANYGHLIATYHFWAPSIDNIMKAANIKNEIITSEVMEIKCYTDPVVNVFDKSTKMKLHMVSPFQTLKSKLNVL